MTTTTHRRRILGASVAMLSVLGLAACNDNEVSSATPPASDAPSASATQAPSSSEAPEETTTESTPEETETSESPSSTSTSTETESDDEDSTAAASGPTEPTEANAELKYGDPAVIEDDDDGTYRLTVESLKVAPDSVYSDTDLKKSNGTVYFVNFKVSPIKPGESDFTTSSVNGLFLHPVFGSDATTKKRLYGDAPGCESEHEDVAIGESGTNCYIYQIDGQQLTDVVFNDYQHKITWTK